LIEQQRAVDDEDVGGNDVPERNLDDIAGNEVGRRAINPGAVAPDARRQCQAPLEKRQSGVRATFLKGGEQDVKEEKRRDHRRRKPLAQDDLQAYRRLEHPRHRRPEMAGESPERMDRFLDDGVRTEFRSKGRGLGRRQAGELGPSVRRRFSQEHAHFDGLT